MDIKKSCKVYLTTKNHLEKSSHKFLVEDVKYDKDKNVIETKKYAEGDVLIIRQVEDLNTKDFIYEDFLLGKRFAYNFNYDEQSRLIEEIVYEYDFDNNYKVDSATMFKYDGNLMTEQLIIQEEMKDLYLFKHNSKGEQIKITHYANGSLISTTIILRKGKEVEHLVLDPNNDLTQREVIISNKHYSKRITYDLENNLTAIVISNEDEKGNVIRVLNYDFNKKLKQKEENTFTKDNLYSRRILTGHINDGIQHISKIYDYVYEEA